MSKYKEGLHKEVSSIFNGVPTQQDNGAEPRTSEGRGEQPSGAPAPKYPDYDRHPGDDKGRLESPAATKPVAPYPPTDATPGPRPTEAEIPTRQEKNIRPDTGYERPRTRMDIRLSPVEAWDTKLQQAWQQIRNKLFTPKPGVSTVRQKAMVVSVPVLFIVLLFVFIRVLSVPSGKRAAIAGVRPSGDVAASGARISWQVPAPYPTALRDPMQFGLAATSRAGAGGLIVRGIVYSEDNPAAVVSDQIVHEGDKVLGATIVKIDKDSVEFEMNGKSWIQKVQR